MKIKKLQTVKEKVFDKLVCDICGKISKEEKPNGWYNFSHGHGAWGNDSCDSYRNFDVCSIECYLKQLKKSLEEMKEYEDRYANIDHKNIKFIEDLIKALEK
jgi:hypothetical protein